LTANFSSGATEATKQWDDRANMLEERHSLRILSLVKLSFKTKEEDILYTETERLSSWFTYLTILKGDCQAEIK
jgi:hypothetical protein